MKIKLRSRDAEFQSLTFDDVERLEASGQLAKIPSVSSARAALFVKEHRDALMAAVEASSGLARDVLGKELDLENIERVVAAVMGSSGLAEKRAGEG